jgi:hypothetical protein
VSISKNPTGTSLAPSPTYLTSSRHGQSGRSTAVALGCGASPGGTPRVEAPISDGCVATMVASHSTSTPHLPLIVSALRGGFTLIGPENKGKWSNTRLGGAHRLPLAMPVALSTFYRTEDSALPNTTGEVYVTAQNDGVCHGRSAINSGGSCGLLGRVTEYKQGAAAVVV